GWRARHAQSMVSARRAGRGLRVRMDRSFRLREESTRYFPVSLVQPARRFRVVSRRADRSHQVLARAYERPRYRSRFRAALEHARELTRAGRIAARSQRARGGMAES